MISFVFLAYRGRVGPANWLVEVCLCIALSCKAFLLKTQEKKEFALQGAVRVRPFSSQKGNKWPWLCTPNGLPDQVYTGFEGFPADMLATAPRC
jgi:hypothetical protein